MASTLTPLFPSRLKTLPATPTVCRIPAPTTVTINDEDPPGSGNGNIYEAAIVGGSARALRGFFVTGPVGFRYREDFNWTLSADGTRFTQTSRYVYQDGPLIGTGGNCFARAVRQ